MARNFIAANSQYLEVTPALVTAAPLTLSAWFRPLSAAAAYDLVLIGDTAGNNYFSLVASNTGSNGAVSAVAATNPGGETSAITTTLFPAMQWSHACATFTSATARAAYLNGGGKGTNTTSKVPVSLAETEVGGYHVGASIFAKMDGQLAEIAIWSIDLSDPEVAALAGRTGESLYQLPLRIRPANLVAYWPLFGEANPEPNRAPTGTARNIATVAGPIAVPHPDFLLPPRRRPVAYVPAGAAPPANPAALLMAM